MSKRNADNYMTDQNWDQEEEQEEAGVFAQADETTLKSRQVKKAKRRGVTDGSSESGTGGIFKSFAGFSKTSTPASAFGSLGSKPLTFSNGSSTASNDQEQVKAPFSFSAETKSSPANVESKPVAEDSVSTNKHSENGGESSKTPPSSRSKYLHQLKALNEGVTKWIKEHVDSNAYCVLTPIFKDYERYLAEIEKKYPPTEEKVETKSQEKMATETGPDMKPEEAADSKVSPTPVGSGLATSSGGFSLTSKPAETSTTTTTTITSPPVFKFGAAAETTGTTSITSATTTSSSMSSGLFSTTSSAVSTSASTGSTFSTGFSFGSGASSVFGSGATTSGFSFAASKLSENKPQTSTGTTEEEEEYVPPKEEVKEVSEDDAIYSKRCKLFFKKGDQWKEKGVGNLHLKPCEEKTQLLIRADTNLGNILLNIMLSTTMPISRQGKNNVTIVCVPNPPVDPKDDPKAMVPMLIRVKTGEDADQLFEKLEENKR